MADSPHDADSTPPIGFLEPEGMSFKSRLAAGRRSHWCLAEQVRLGRPVALKTLRPELAADAGFRESFFEAGRQAANLRHKAAVPVINIYERENCIAMSLADGRPLLDLGGSLDALSLADTGAEVMDCLALLHATGRWHGNLSPGNIFFRNGAGVWIGDFFQPPIMSSKDFSFSGDHRFIAPERVSGGAGDWRSDIFGLGACLSHAAAPEALSGWLGRFLDRLRSPDPADRGASPEHVASVFQSLRKQELRDGGGPAGENTILRRRRLYRRIPAEFEVSLRRRSATPSETVAILMRVRDVSESGVFVETDDPLITVGSVLELDLALRGQGGNVHVFGVVRWRSSPPMPEGVGVQFVEVDQEGLNKLRRYLSSTRGRT